MFLLKTIRIMLLRKRKFPSQWLEIIERNVAIYHRLPAPDKKELLEHVQIFLAEKHFEGCAGLEITDEIRVTIAAQACMLLLHRKTDYYPMLVSILVYPNSYLALHHERDSIGVVTEELQQRLGESWSRGVVVLSWDDVRAGASDLQDGHNLVLHEFAHQLDSEDGTVADGTVVLPRRSMYVAWARILGQEYVRLRKEAAKGHSTLFDSYGANSPAEFFAVATELFFEKPAPFQKKHPELYKELKLYYQQDPASYMT